MVVLQALYASKICSYAQGMNLIRAKSLEQGWDLNLGELARIWKGGCIIRAIFLDRIKKVGWLTVAPIQYCPYSDFLDRINKVSRLTVVPF